MFPGYTVNPLLCFREAVLGQCTLGSHPSSFTTSCASKGRYASLDTSLNQKECSAIWARSVILKPWHVYSVYLKMKTHRPQIQRLGFTRSMEDSQIYIFNKYPNCRPLWETLHLLIWKIPSSTNIVTFCPFFSNQFWTAWHSLGSCLPYGNNYGANHREPPGQVSIYA
jgi:hypothetical protein